MNDGAIFPDQALVDRIATRFAIDNCFQIGDVIRQIIRVRVGLPVGQHQFAGVVTQHVTEHRVDRDPDLFWRNHGDAHHGMIENGAEALMLYLLPHPQAQQCQNDKSGEQQQPDCQEPSFDSSLACHGSQCVALQVGNNKPAILVLRGIVCRCAVRYFSKQWIDAFICPEPVFVGELTVPVAHLRPAGWIAMG